MTFTNTLFEFWGKDIPQHMYTYTYTEDNREQWEESRTEVKTLPKTHGKSGQCQVSISM